MIENGVGRTRLANSEQIEAAEVAQHHLLQTLSSYWLYVSVKDESLASWIRGRFRVDAHILREAARALEGAGATIERAVARPELYRATISPRHFAEILAELFRSWEALLPQLPPADLSGSPERVPRGRRYDEWLAAGGASERYASVHALRALVSGRCASLFRRAIVHGSVGTLDDEIGFSDLDLAFVVAQEALTDPDELLRLRAASAEILSQAYAFDPYMHHGPFCIPEIDLAWYPEAFLPLLLFEYGVDLLDAGPEAEVRVIRRPSEDQTRAWMTMTERFAEAIPFARSGFDLEWWMGTVMLLPAIFLQHHTGEFRYKRDTFGPAAAHFSREAWEPVERATEVRKWLGPRPEISRRALNLAVKLRWPGLIPRLARASRLDAARTRTAVDRLGGDFPTLAMGLLAEMKRRMAADEDALETGTHV